MNETVMKIPPPKKHPSGVFSCFSCGGSGRNPDGSVMVSNTEVRIRHASPCWMCEGSGLIRVEPYTENSE